MSTQQSISFHARQRVKERYGDNTSKTLRIDMHEAIAIRNYIAIPNENPNRVTAYFSKDKHFLWKVVLSKNTGDVVTALPIVRTDVDFAIEKGIIDPKLRW